MTTARKSSVNAAAKASRPDKSAGDLFSQLASARHENDLLCDENRLLRQALTLTRDLFVLLRKIDESEIPF